MFTAAALARDGKNVIFQGDAKEKPSDRHPVDQICDAVTQLSEEKAIAAISQILQSVSIDVYNGKTGHTAISQLAARGAIKEANFLTKQFNASRLWMLYGLAQRDPDTAKDFYEKEAKIEPASCNELLKQMALGFARSDHEKSAFLLLERSEVKANAGLRDELLKWMAADFTSSGYEKSKQSINKFLLLIREDKRAVNVLIKELVNLFLKKEASLFASKTALLRTLSGFHAEFQERIVKELASNQQAIIKTEDAKAVVTAVQEVRFTIKAEETKAIAVEAQEIRSTMQWFHYTFNQASAIRQPDVRGFYLNFQEILRYIPRQGILLCIVPYLACMDDRDALQLRDFAEREERFRRVKAIQHDLTQGITRYAEASGFLGFFRDTKADADAGRCREIESEEELTSLLIGDAVASDRVLAEPYQAILRLHYEALQKLNSDQKRNNKDTLVTTALVVQPAEHQATVVVTVPLASGADKKQSIQQASISVLSESSPPASHEERTLVIPTLPKRSAVANVEPAVLQPKSACCVCISSFWSRDRSGTAAESQPLLTHSRQYGL